jgi:hypothetical protein
MRAAPRVAGTAPGAGATSLLISTEDGVHKVRVFGGTVSKKQVADEAAPNVGPGNTGADQNDAQMAAPAPVGNQAQPDAQPAADQGPAAACGAGDGDVDPGDAGAASLPPDAGGDDQDAAQNQQVQPREPNAAAPSADGPDNGA